MAAVHRLPEPVADEWEWQLRGACRGVDSSLFFNPDGERASVRIQREAVAKQMCRRCPVLARCRRHALEVHEAYGVWGGMSKTERERVWRVRSRELAIQGNDAQAAGGQVS